MATRARRNRIGGGAKSEANRWNMGAPAVGEDFDTGFVTAYNVRGPHWELERMATMPVSSIPPTMGGQMGADEHVTWTSGGGRRGRRGRR
jgi:hypothetical protein